MVEPNLESLVKDLYNHARHDLSEDLVAALLETLGNATVFFKHTCESLCQNRFP